MQINRNPTPRELRHFGFFLWGFATLICGLNSYWTGNSQPWLGIWLVALGLGALGQAHLPSMKRLFLGISYLTFPIGWVISHLTLALIFYTVLTPIALVLRLRGRDSMRRRIDPEAVSYWDDHPASEDAGRYFRQF